jgi:uncharacterized protein YcbK (DUF882 family)
MSEHFKASEFNCKCCGKGGDKINPKLLQLLEAIRVKLDAPITILSGYRCEAHNTECGGKKKSQHMLGNAADITTGKMKPLEFYSWLEDNFHIDGHGKYPGFNHIDVRGSKARW